MKPSVRELLLIGAVGATVEGDLIFPVTEGETLDGTYRARAFDGSGCRCRCWW